MGCKACSGAVLGFTEENAVIKWNTRQQDGIINELVEALEEIADMYIETAEDAYIMRDRAMSAIRKAKEGR